MKMGRAKRQFPAVALAALVGAAAIAGCGGGGDNSFVDQNGTQVIVRGEPSEELRRAVARVITDPVQEVNATEEELATLRALSPLFSANSGFETPPVPAPNYDPALGSYINEFRTSIGKDSRLSGAPDGSIPDGEASGRTAEPSVGFVSAYTTGISINGGKLAGTGGSTSLQRRSDQTYRFEFRYQIGRNLRSVKRTSESPYLLNLKVRGMTTSDRAGRIEYNATVEQSETRSSNTVTVTSRVIRRPDRSGERSGTYTFNGEAITVRVRYGPGGTGTGTLTGTASGLPARIAIGERVTSVTYSDEKTVVTFDRPQPTARGFD